MDKVISHNGLSRNDTDTNIRKMLGTLDDFLLTSMASQLDSLAFIKEGSARRKEILAKFLDLEIFDKKFKLAKDDASDLRGALKRLEGREFETDIETISAQIKESEESIEEHKQQCDTYEQQIEDNRQLLNEIENKITSIPLEVIDIETVRNALKTKKNDTYILSKRNEEASQEKSDNIELVDRLSSFLKDTLPDMISNITEVRQQSINILEEIDNLDVDKLNNYLEKYNLLVEKQKQVKQEISVSELEIENNLSKIEVYRHEIEDIESEIEVYESNRETIEKN